MDKMSAEVEASQALKALTLEEFLKAGMFSHTPQFDRGERVGDFVNEERKLLSLIHI